ncbi:MAG: Ig-like domain-containing protein [Gemmatimonadales bacterium]
MPEVEGRVGATSYGEASAIEVTGGAGQTGTVGQPLADPLVIRITDDGGNPVVGQVVEFVVMSGGGTVVANATETDETGTISASWTLGTSTAQEQIVEVQMAQSGAAAIMEAVRSLVDPILFTATAMHDQPTGLSFTTQPVNTVAGAGFSVAVTEVDQYGNPGTSASSVPVTLAIAAGSGAAGANLSGTNPVSTMSGVATFNGMSIDTAGQGYLLEATGAGLADATSASFDVEMGTVATVEVTPAVATANSLGEVVSFTAVARNGSGIEVPGVTFTWSESSSGTVATIDQNGQATAVGNGTTEVTATTSGVSGSADLTVNQVMASIALSPAAATLTAIGATQQFTAQALDANGNPLPTQPTFTWGGGGTVASVSPTGLATALTQGTTAVTATSGVTVGSANLTVTQDINSIVVTPALVTLDAIGATQQFTAEAQDINGNPLPIQPSFTWSSSDEAVATVGVTSGLATTTGNGSADIVASAAGMSGSASLTVTQAIGSIVVTPASATLDAVGDTQPYTAEARDLSGVPLATQPTFTWSSGNDAVATVDETTGLATAVANGSVNIMASAAGVTGSANLTVAQVTSLIVVTPAAATIEAIDGTAQFTAQALDGNGNPMAPQPAFTWGSNNQPIATVGVTSGLATGHAAGAAQISASADGAIGVADLTVAQTVASIVVTPPAVTLNAFGASQQYSAEAHDANGYALTTQPTFTWSESSSEAVATIDATGLATAAGNGTTQISASVSGVTGSVGLTVTQTISTIVVDPPTATLTSVGATQQFTAEARDANDFPLETQPAFTWGGGGSVATVDGSGMATAQAQGTTDITATAGSVTGSAALTVTQAISSIVVTPAGVTLTAFGQEQQYSAQALDAGANPLEIQPTFGWTSSNEGVATVGAVDGLAQAMGNGTTQILASAGGVTGGIDLTVAQIATSVVVSPAALTLNAIGGTQPYTAEARDANDNPLTTQPAFAWTESSAGAVATIDPATGLATATGNGTSVITATGAGVSGDANLTVTQTAASIVVTPNPVTLNSIGVTQQFAAQALDANSNPLVTQPTFVWSETSSGAVATVDASGLATTGGDGSTEITATGGGVSGFADLTVTQIATSIVVTPNPVTLSSIGVTQQFAAQALDANSTPLVTQPSFVWTETSSGAVATVDASGMATTAGNGATQITATADAVSGFADLTVAQVADSIAVTFGQDTLIAVGDTTPVNAEAFDANGTAMVTQPSSFTFASLDEAIATVSPLSGSSTTATAVTNGDATIQATADGVTGGATLTVEQAIDSVAVTLGQDTLAAIGATTSANAEAFDANGNPLAPQPTSYNWSSLNTAVATVSPAAGVNTTAEAVADGAADIQAEVGGVTGSATLAVTQAVDSIAVTFVQDTLQSVGATTSVIAQAVDLNGNLLATQPTSYSWSSLNMTVATVSPATGLNTTAEAVANGKAAIQAEVDGVTGRDTLTVAQLATQIQVTLNAANLNALGDTTTASAEAQDANGNPLVPQPASFTWSSLDTAVATVSPATGLTTIATADSNGTADIQAAIDTVNGSATLTVDLVPTKGVVTPAAASRVVRGTQVFNAVARDANDSVLAMPPSFTWTSLNTAVVTVVEGPDTTTTATAVANGITQVVATAGTLADTAAVTVGAYVWTGAGTGDNWSTAENWSPAGPPTAGSDVVINVDGARVVYDAVGGAVAANDITIDGTATLAVDSVDFSIGGKLTIEQNAIFEIDFATITAEIDNKGTWNVFHNASTLINPSAGSAHTNSGTVLMHVPLFMVLEDATFTNTGTMTINDMISIDMSDTPALVDRSTVMRMRGVLRLRR